MILLLSTKANPGIPADLAALGDVSVMRVPAPPQRPETPTGADLRSTRPWQPNPFWADRAVRRVRRAVREDRPVAVVCADRGARPFARRLAEQLPTTPVIMQRSQAARVLTDLMARTAGEQGARIDRAAVYRALNQGEVVPPAAPNYLYDRSTRPPLIVQLVNNPVAGDSRVQKIAESLAAAGYGSVLLGISAKNDLVGDWWMIGDAAVLRLPVDRDGLRGQLQAPPQTLPARMLGYHSESENSRAWRHHRRRLESAAPGEGPGLATRALGRWTELRSWLYWRNRRSFNTLDGRRAAHERRASWVAARFNPGDPESVYPFIDDIEDRFAPLIDRLEPAGIHVHDPMLLGIALRARHRLATRGIDTCVVYDSHEWTAGLKRENAYQVAALQRIERDALTGGEVAATITVSDTIADLMVQTFGLSQRPTVVTNAPKSGIASADRDIRTDAGVGGDVPLLLYVGALAASRGVEDALAALALLPRAHLALLAPPDSFWLGKVRKAADEAGVAARVHVLDYVPADMVAGYIRTADVALIPFRPHVNSELGIPTKFREYLLAGLPMVSTDRGVTADEIRRTGVGELCPPEDPAGMAAAVERVLTDRDRYIAAITPELVAEHSWSGQEPRLVDVYRGLLDQPPAPPPRVPVLFAGANTLDQTAQLAGALRKSGTAARSLTVWQPGDPEHSRVDSAVPRSSATALERRIRLLLHEVAPAAAVVLESGRPVAAPEPGPVSDSAGFREARAIRDSGRSAALLFHSPDLRRSDSHMGSHPASPYPLLDPALVAAADAAARRNLSELAWWTGPVLASTPDAAALWPGSRWVPLVVPPGYTAVAAPERRLPVVMQRAPEPGQSAAPQDRVLPDLAAAGEIELINLPAGRDWPDPDELARCDVFVDRLGWGCLGADALAAMASGAAVIADPGPEAKAAYAEALPLIAESGSGLADTVRSLIGDPALRTALAQAGPGFVMRHHNGAASAAAIMDALAGERAGSPTLPHA